MLLDAVQSRRLIEIACADRFAILAINADSPGAVVDALEAARQAAAPVIIETSLWQLTGHAFGQGDAVAGMTRYITWIASLCDDPRYRAVPVIYHTDHIKGPETLPLLTQAIRGLPVRIQGHDLLLRPSTLSLDSSELSAAENIAHLSELCHCADTCAQPVCLEMEAGVDEGLTDPAETEALFGAVEQRYPGKLALWAPGVGTRHGYSDEGFPGFSSAHVAQQRDLVTRLAGRPIGIALHGSSGLSDEQLAEAVQAGVCKVNWSTDSLALRSAAAATYYAAQQAQLQRGHASFKQTAMDHGVQSAIAAAYVPVVVERMEVLGAAGRAAMIRDALETIPA